jgi:hypothetical protein
MINMSGFTNTSFRDLAMIRQKEGEEAVKEKLEDIIRGGVLLLNSAGIDIGPPRNVEVSNGNHATHDSLASKIEFALEDEPSNFSLIEQEYGKIDFESLTEELSYESPEEEKKVLDAGGLKPVDIDHILGEDDLPHLDGDEDNDYDKDVDHDEDLETEIPFEETEEGWRELYSELTSEIAEHGFLEGSYLDPDWTHSDEGLEIDDDIYGEGEQVLEGEEKNAFFTAVHELFHRAQSVELVGKVSGGKTPMEYYESFKQGIEESCRTLTGEVKDLDEFMNATISKPMKYPLAVYWSEVQEEGMEDEIIPGIARSYQLWRDSGNNEILNASGEMITDKLEENGVKMPLELPAREAFAHMVSLSLREELNQEKERKNYIQEIEEAYNVLYQDRREEQTGTELRQIFEEVYQEEGPVQGTTSEQIQRIQQLQNQYADQYRAQI